MSPRRANSRNGNAKNSNASPPLLDQEVSNADFRNTIQMVGNVAYELEFPGELAVVHPIFHISLLKKCIGDPASVVPFHSVAVKDNLYFKDVPAEINDYHVLKVEKQRSLFSQGSVEELATWEAEAAMKAEYPHLFPSNSTSY
ncbi:uncharacterized protein LOC107030197 [Solanum pennellii]|uniref:Uncharacterized protein LOC107030197 n=1 Tax=Solanum pennellii TaxID=28526 RepID=A0ABM1HL24_SOLPN|nr:uncharacterized protein LOC107030197 [Solanum pennellii]